MKTVIEQIKILEKAFLALPSSQRKKLSREAFWFMRQNPGAADHSIFWRGLSARQVHSLKID